MNRKCKLQIIERVRHVIYWQMQFHRQDSIEKLGFALNFSTTQPSLCELKVKFKKKRQTKDFFFQVGWSTLNHQERIEIEGLLFEKLVGFGR